MATTKAVWKTENFEEYNREKHGDVLCNKCGQSCCVIDSAGYICGPHGLNEECVFGGYMSTHLQDLVMYRFSLCESCLAELFSSFYITINEIDYFQFRSDLNGNPQKEFKELINSFKIILGVFKTKCKNFINKSNSEYFTKIYNEIDDVTDFLESLKKEQKMDTALE